MNRYLVVLLLCLAMCGKASAQFHSLPFEWNLHVGGSYFSAPALNNAMQEQGVSTISPVGINVALGIGYRFGKVVVGGNVSSMYGIGRDSEFTATTPTAYIATNMFYINRWVVTPSLGFGPQFTTAVINKNNVTGDFDEYLTIRSNQTRLRHIVPVADLGITVKTYDLLTATYRPKFKVGYQMGVSRQAWKVGNAELINAPNDRTGTVYLQISMGIGR
ncbi:hypothetical protein M8998_12040 [Sphingobacterium sp. lm-10]|uniref:hypothetical protein n=1 Tax=Sphingobacterium sp. lm-10 TaxID=2944904 RepID=UPI002022266D|nr:hypothetical protein [Sphingobacterium sp. lm-10]MCL7988669.1 hypothetical protein [Sphingobacterium sp. lm-10]